MRVIVAGGGVAGAASAVALGRLGAEVAVYEAHTDPAGPVGSFVSLAVNGLRGLEVLGCLPPVQQAGFAVARQRLWASNGRLLGDLPRGRRSGDRLHSVTLLRADLVRTLRELAEGAGARILTDQRLVGATSTGASVQATFASGHTDHADLLVGADGIWSATRAILDAAAPTPTYAGLYSVSGQADGAGIQADPGTFNMIFARNGAFLYVPTPDGSLWWSAQIASPQQPHLSDVSDQAWLDRLAGLFCHEQQTQAVLQATTRLHHPTRMHVLTPVRTWHRDRIVLLGDAAHPVGAGQGAAMAIEDAVVLAQQLATASSIPAALSADDRSRRARIAKLVKAASHNRDAKTAGPLGRAAGNLLMPVFFRFFYERATAWLYTHDPGTLPPSPTASRPGKR
jgi:2-polyprenyl-6-methoxyphenol hydroxylase-like FAD-dependent oxidoreductase